MPSCTNGYVIIPKAMNKGKSAYLTVAPLQGIWQKALGGMSHGYMKIREYSVFSMAGHHVYFYPVYNSAAHSKYMYTKKHNMHSMTQS